MWFSLYIFERIINFSILNDISQYKFHNICSKQKACYLENLLRLKGTVRRYKLIFIVFSQDRAYGHVIFQVITSIIIIFKIYLSRALSAETQLNINMRVVIRSAPSIWARGTCPLKPLVGHWGEGAPPIWCLQMNLHFIFIY